MLSRALAGFVVVAVLVAIATWRAARLRTLGTYLQFGGAVLLLVVVLTHIAEALGLLGRMRWGAPDSPGHYIDLVSAVLGGLLFVLGCAVSLRRWSRRSSSQT